MASDLNSTTCIGNRSSGDKIMSATFNCEETLAVSKTDVAISGDSVNLDSPRSASCESNPNNKQENDMFEVTEDLNKTFAARKIKSDNSVIQRVILDKTVNLLKLGDLSSQVESEDSLGIINDLLDENTSLDLLVPFKSTVKSNVQFLKKSDKASLAFSPLHLRNSNGVNFEDDGSPMICRFTSTPEPSSSKLQEKNLEIIHNFSSEEKANEFDITLPKRSYEDFKSGNIFTSTSKGALLKNCLELFDASSIVPNYLQSENNEVQPKKDNTLKTNSANHSPLCLNATFDVKAESLMKVLPISDLQTKMLSASFEDIPKNNTYTFDNMNNAAEEKDNKGNTTIVLPEKKESNPSNSREESSCCSSISKVDQSIGPDSGIIKSTKLNFESKKIFKSGVAIPKQKLNSSQKASNMNSKLNSTLCMEESKPSNNNPTKLDKRCSLGSFKIPGNSKISSFRTHSQPKLNLVCNLRYNGCKPLELKTQSSTRSTISMRNDESAIKKKGLISIPLLSTAVIPEVCDPIKEPNADEKVLLNNTFTKDNKINKALSPIIEKENHFTESMEDISDVQVNKNGTFKVSKVDVGIKEISESIPCGNKNTCAPVENENKKISTFTKCLAKPSVLTKGIHKAHSTNIPFPNNHKQSCNANLVSNIKTGESILRNQNKDINEKLKSSQTKTNRQLSSLPTLCSTFSKKLIVNKPKDNEVMSIDSSKACNSKPVQPIRGLRAPRIFIRKEKIS